MTKEALLPPTEAAAPTRAAIPLSPLSVTSSKSTSSFALVATSPFVRIFHHIVDTTTDRPLSEVTVGISSITRGISDSNDIKTMHVTYQTPQNTLPISTSDEVESGLSFLGPFGEAVGSTTDVSLTTSRDCNSYSIAGLNSMVSAD